MKTASPYLLKLIYYLYLLLFTLTPFLFYPFTHYFPIPWIIFGSDPQTYELFEFNKMFFVYGIAVLVLTVWAIRSVEEKRIIFRKTYLDYPLSLFLLSQILSTIFSLDIHTSVWGYYSRFHGGLMSSIAYLILYWGLVSNLFEKKYVHRFLKGALFSAVVVSLYGVAQHFGIDKDFWVQNVQARVFSSLGQPNWLAAFLVSALPVGISYFLFESRWYFKLVYLVSCVFLFTAFLFTASRSGLLALVIAHALYLSLVVAQKYTDRISKFKIAGTFLFFCIAYILGYYKYPQLAVNGSLFAFAVSVCALSFVSSKANRAWIISLGLVFIISGFLYSSPDAFRLNQTGTATGGASPTEKVVPQDAGGTETGAIRFIVWKGAWEIFKHYPVLGSGVESFAYSFYQYRPLALLKTAEWDFLYNKAHNEYFNILATTGLFGVAVYGFYLLSVARHFLFMQKSFEGKSFPQKVEKIDLKVDRMKKQLDHDLRTNLNIESNYFSYIISVGLLCALATILITNFFGFSVVNVAIFFFLFPAFLDMLTTKERFSIGIERRVRGLLSRIKIKNRAQEWMYLILYGFCVFLGMYSFSTLFNYWFADIRFAEAKQLNRSGQIGQAHKQLIESLALRKDEPLYYSELGWTESEIVYSLMKENDASSAAQVVPLAESNSLHAVTSSPNNVLFWKKLADSYYNLSFYDKAQYTDELRKAADRARTLAPTDVSTLLILSNYYERINDSDTAVKIVTQATEWKPDLAEAWNRLGELYFSKYQSGKNIEDKKKAEEFREKAAALDTTNEGYKKSFE